MASLRQKVFVIFLITLSVLFVSDMSDAVASPALKSVRVIYLVPKDRAPRQEYLRAIENTVLDLQSWYYGHLNGKTFRLNNPIVEVRKTAHNAAWYDKHTPKEKVERKYNTFYNALAEAASLGAKADDPNYIWLIYIDAPGGTGAGMRGVAILPEHDLLGLVGKAADRTSVMRWIGGCGHELGHGFGLDHPGDRNQRAIMQTGYTSYPAAYLTNKDVSLLNRSSFIHAGIPGTFRNRGRFVYLYSGGYFIHAGGRMWQERKTGSESVFNFEAQKDDGTYIHLLDRSRKPGAWVLLPKQGKGNDIYFKWEGEQFKKVFTAK
jgi:hypothetical protein